MQKIKYDVYRSDLSYEENYEKGPFFDLEIPKRPKSQKPTEIFGHKINNPIGVPAGPLLNSNWTTFYAQMGFDVPVYKTVRSVATPCHPTPNCVYVHPDTPLRSGQNIDLTNGAKPEFVENLTITNSFGVPSMTPDIWMADIEKANKGMADGQVLVVSSMGTPELAERSWYEDYAYTAAMTVEAGAKIIEINYSCPNLKTCGGQTYADPEASSEISKKVRAAIGPNIPLLIKIGNLEKSQLEAVVKANRPYVDGFAGINTIPGIVRNSAGEAALPGRLTSGLCGAGITEEAQVFTKNISQIRAEMNDDFVVFGSGGVMNTQQFQDRLDAGADVVMSATAAMWDPFIAHRIFG